ncbi:START-like domain-containing protein [uncultured Bacteroides sp.]|uniref:START-like domain-containing protein n=1 Tax=uncultured Bacteroides sp. TaxID=162156 RepID=UPI00262B3172|nr:START-like domain-containing protein [uncultured Bacteroides sp.]
MKKKIHIEYPLSSASGAVLWGAISTPSGLQRWFADQVTKDDKVFTFTWGKTETRKAEMINQRTESFIRFHWKDDEPKTYFELKLQYNELTNDQELIITDFVDPSEEEDSINLWNSQIEVLRRTCGI